MNLSDERKNEIADKRRDCFPTDGIYYCRLILSGRHFGKLGGSARDRGIEGPINNIPLRSGQNDPRNSGNVVGEGKRVFPFYSGRV